MSQNEVVGIDIVARLDDFRAELAKIPDIGGKEAKALTSQLSREIKKATTASKREAAQSRKTAAAYRTQAKAARLAKTDTSGLSKAFNSSAKKAAALFLTIEMGKKIFSSLSASVGELLDSDTEVERFKTQFDEMRLLVMIPLAASVRGVASATADMMTQFGRSEDFTTLAQNMRTVFYEIAIPAMSAFIATGQQIGVVVASIGKAAADSLTIGASLMRVKDALSIGDFKGLKVIFAETNQAARDLAFAIPDVGDALSDSREKWNQFSETASKSARDAENSISGTVRVTKELERATAASAAGIIASRERLRQSYIESANARQATADRSIADEERVVAAQKQAIAEVAAARKAAAEEERSLRSSLAITAIETASNVANSIIDGLEQVLLANVQEAKKRRDIELGLAILRGELQAAAAFGTTLATYGATPQGFALAAAAAAAVGISSKAAAVAAHAGSAEHFHSGGLASDEGTAILRAGEGVLTPSAVSAVGGERGLRDLNANAGAGGDGGSRTLQIGARAFDALVSQSLTSKGSVLTRSLAALRARPGGYRVHG